MAILYLILALLIAVVAIIFAWQNTAIVSITFLMWELADIPLSFVIVATLVIGIVIGWLFTAPSLIRNTFRASGHRKRIGVLEKELEDHKAKLSEVQKPAMVTPPAAPRPATPASSATKSDTDPLGHS